MVLVINKHKQPCNTISEAYARILLFNKQAVIHKRFPFTIRLRNDNAVLKDRNYTLKFDPGSRTTGVAITDDQDSVVMLAEIEHRGHIIKKNLDSRRAVRRFRRQRKTRYRGARFQNRVKSEGWLAPSVKSRADNVINFVRKLKRFLNISNVKIERVSFDVAQMSSDKELQGKDYRQGALYQTELRSFLFKKHNGRCVYCSNKAEEIEHLIPKSKGGTDSVHNLVIACRKCNELKGKLSLKEFEKVVGKDFSHLEPKELPKHAAIVQSARNYMFKEISKIVPNTVSYDAWLTKYNREELGLPKQHYYDALSVGEIKNYKFLTDKVLQISAKGRGSRQMCRMDSYGFPRTSAKSSKSVKGFQTGDIVKAIVPFGSKAGEYLGKVAVRSSGSFNIQTKAQVVQGIGYKYCHIVQRSDGYLYDYKGRDLASLAFATGATLENLSAMNCQVSVANV